MHFLFYLQLSPLQRRFVFFIFGSIFLFFSYHMRFAHAFESLHKEELSYQANQKTLQNQQQLIKQTASIIKKIKMIQENQPKKTASEILLESAQQNHIIDTQISSETKNTLTLHFSAHWDEISHFLETLSHRDSPMALKQLSLQTHDDSDILFSEMHMRLTPVNTEDIPKSTENPKTRVKGKDPFHLALTNETDDTELQSPEHFLWRGYLILNDEAIAFYQNADGLMTAVKKGDLITPGDWSVVSIQESTVVLKNTEGKVLNIPLRH